MDKLERLAAEHSALQPAEQKEFRMTNELCERMLLTLDSLSVSGAALLGPDPLVSAMLVLSGTQCSMGSVVGFCGTRLPYAASLDVCSMYGVLRHGAH